MHFKIEKSGCVEHKGLFQVRADFYDDKILTEVKIFPKEGYQGKMVEEGIGSVPADMEDYQKWYEGLPTEKKLLPVHSHFIYFDHTVTDEEIIFCFEIAKSWLENGLPMKNVKPVFKPNDLSAKVSASARIESIKTADFTKVNNAELYSVK